MFKEEAPAGFPEREEEVLAFWRENAVFKKSLEKTAKGKNFSFYDGPPFATGLPHYGHLLAGTIKDVVPRYKTMKGYHVPRRFGWDCHGIPIESKIEKDHNLSGAASIEAFGIDKFNESCRSIVLKYTKEWYATVERMARWVDTTNPYHTMDLSFMESVWWVFKQLFEKGLVYEGFKVMPFSAALGTPLSNSEAGENYKEVDDPSLTVTMPLEGDEDTALLAWTTTPWTLPSNLALAVGEEIDYVKILDKPSGKRYILAKERLSAYYKDEADYELLETLKGKALEGLHYIPPFDYFSELREQKTFRVLLDPVVSTEDGTGIVHMAPAFGEADFFACQLAKIPMVCPVDRNGRFTKEVSDYEGLFVKDADKDIIKRLKGAGRIVRHGTCRHRYPFCPRTDTPIIYRTMMSWFVAVEQFKDQIIDAVKDVHWTPGHLKEGRFGKWLEGARDWAISRNRYWGTPIPLWRSEDGDIICIGSIKELEELTGAKITDLHRHHIDQLTFEKDGKSYRRIEEVFDCWFESGSMPYAQLHYPFENEEAFEARFPADFVAEGLDQTRCWFYNLNVLSTALFNKPAFKNVIVNGILLAEDGTKMSKRLRNYPDPTKMIDKYGADAIRLYMLHSPAVKADDLCFSERGLELVLRQIMIPWWNAYSFFITYARLYQWEPNGLLEKAPENSLDRWILACLHQLIHRVEDGMDAYDLNRAVEPFVSFIDQLTNWYIRRSRRRFWAEEDSQDRRDAFATLYTVLVQLSKVAAPFVPFISEKMYRNLRTESMPESVHLCDFPHYQPELRDAALEDGMAAAQAVVSAGHRLRKEQKIKVRQPLPTAHIVTGDEAVLEHVKAVSSLIADELNVKEIQFSTDESRFVSLSVKPNFPVLGKKVGKQMRAVQQAIGGFSQVDCATLFDGNAIDIQLDGESFALQPEDVMVQREVRDGFIAENTGALTIVLDTTLDEVLLQEGLAREIVNKINSMRRDAGFEVSDRIAVKIDSSDRVKDCYDEWGSYICHEVLCTSWSFESAEGTEWDLNGEAATISIAKVETARG